ncbi:hypothetical protein [Chlorogloea sp. CCALA 695]|uniref:hypothetical protein n=1 Tax=Chlorogloea sp. CCALA 695 TaxID=2107693 RepID=UPI0011B1F4D5|nr:hypothetical protein [Chlorogloea sp. CCALA 695]
MTLFAGGLGGIESEERLPRKMSWEATRPRQLWGRQSNPHTGSPTGVWGQTLHTQFFLRQAL